MGDLLLSHGDGRTSSPHALDLDEVVMPGGIGADDLVPAQDWSSRRRLSSLMTGGNSSGIAGGFVCAIGDALASPSITHHLKNPWSAR